MEESAVTIQKKEAMMVFTADHPRPDYALKDGQEIAKGLRAQKK